MAASVVSTTIHRLLFSARDAVSLRGRKLSWMSISCSVASANGRLVVISMTCASISCSACASRSAATNRGLAVSSAITNTSDGPAGISIATPYC